uniref:Integrase catalytic domain-containing protein n=1 Tax=Fagus sylvatica TaxID=28930 RepID=A0A2N9G9A2_FAGSY
MATAADPATIRNTNDAHQTLISINVAAQAPLKLNSTNYLSWKLQFQTLFIGYDLLGYIDGSKPCPPATLTQDNATRPNPEYILWIRQDQLILNAVIGSILPTIIPFIAQATTSRQAWTILANTYAKPSRGRIKQIKNQLKNTTKGSLSVTEFMQTIKTRADDLALLGASLDEEEITDKILDGLGDEYKELVRAVQARDTSITFEELHEKLLNFEVSLQSTPLEPHHFPATANPTYRTNNKSWRPSQPQGTTTTNWRPSYNSTNRSPAGTTTGSRNPPRPYLGHCQICRIQGHTAKRCPSFRLVPVQNSPTSNSPQQGTPWQPQAHLATHPSTTPSWLMDSGASHHVTSDLDNLSLHTPYIGTDDIMIGDGSNLPITHTGSTSLKTSQHTFTLDNVLCALHTGTILLQGQTKDGVYEWPTSSPFTAFSTIKTTSFDWHHRLGHPAFSILKHIVSSNHLGSSSSLSSDFSSDFLSTNGISHLTTPPHTPEHNGYSERRHLHIVETGLALLTHASLPRSYWTYAFATAVYLINRMPTPTLNLSSPYHKIFQTTPNYSKLRVFGCLCYPWLRPYTSHKLESRSKPCVFLGYSLTQSAYYCLDPSTSRIYVSRHVKFVESQFPYSSVSGPSSIPHSNPINTWIPAPIKVMSSTSQPPLNMPSEGFTPQQTQSAASTSIPIQPPSTNTAQNTQTTTPSLTSSTNTTPPLHNPPETTTLPTHTMTTRAKNNIHKPITKMNLHTQLSKSNGLEPTTVTKALLDPKWRKAMSDECDALVKNGTWELVPPNSTQNIVGCKWIFRIKRNSDGSIDRFKARLVAKGFHQRPGVDYLDTFSPVVKPTTVRVVLSLAVSRGWSLRQLDVNNAFLQGHLSETVHMQQPPGFVDQDHPSYVCKLRKAIYGLKQAPRAWYHELRTFLLSSGFKNSHADTSLFVLTTAAQKMYILVYVDDLIITGDNTKMIDSFVDGLAHRFSIKDLGQLSYFLGVEVVPNQQGILLSQRRYILDILARTHMTDAKPVLTPIPTSPPLLKSGTALPDPTEYRTIVGSLQYLLITRPDLAFAVNKLSQYMHTPTTDHWSFVKRLLRYLCGTINEGLQIHRKSPLNLHAYSDADWAGDKDDFSSTSAYVIYLGRNPVSWSSKKQKTIARSSTEAEYRSVANAAAELNWLCYLLTDLGVQLPYCPVLYCDNVGATQALLQSCVSLQDETCCHRLSLHQRSSTKWYPSCCACILSRSTCRCTHQASSPYPFSRSQIQDWTPIPSSILRGHIITQRIATDCSCEQLYRL